MSNILQNDVYGIVVALHVAAGTIALVAFWTAGFARKRRGLHVRAGTVYLFAMRAILVTAIPMALTAFARGQTMRGIFLSYLVVLVATTVYIAPRAVRLKQDFEAFRSGAYRVFAWVLPIAALATFAAGIVAHAPILWGFSLVGAFVTYNMQRTLRRTKPEPGWWLRVHYTAMIGNGIGTHVAFFSIGLSHLLPADLAGVTRNLPWFGPLAIGLLVRAWLDRKHRRKFAQAGRRMAAATSRSEEPA